MQANDMAVVCYQSSAFPDHVFFSDGAFVYWCRRMQPDEVPEDDPLHCPLIAYLDDQRYEVELSMSAAEFCSASNVFVSSVTKNQQVRGT